MGETRTSQGKGKQSYYPPSSHYLSDEKVWFSMQGYDLARSAVLGRSCLTFITFCLSLNDPLFSSFMSTDDWVLSPKIYSSMKYH